MNAVGGIVPKTGVKVRTVEPEGVEAVIPLALLRQARTAKMQEAAQRLGWQIHPRGAELLADELARIQAKR